MRKKVLLGLAGLVTAIVVGSLALAASKPDHLHIERSLLIETTPEQAFPYANDFTLFITWMPWAELDPNQTVEFSEPPSGVGAWYTWQGNKDVGKGRMEILSSEPNTKVVHKLEFIEPFESVAESTMLFEDAGDGKHVKVTWSYDEESGFGSKLMQVFVDMDTMLGADFEKGLNNLAAKL